MGDYHSTEAEIDTLALMIQSELQRTPRADWRSVWAQIKSVGVSFKGTKYPTPEDQRRAWDRFQQLVSQVKESEEIERQGQQQRCAELERELAELDRMFPSWLSGRDGPDWRSIWDQTARVKSLFKNVRYPTREDRDRAWARFQALESKAKEAKDKERNSQGRECAKLEKQIEELRFMLPGWFSSGSSTDWKPIWAQIRQVGALFKEVRFTDPQARERAWDRFQKMVARVKEDQGKEQAVWDAKHRDSAMHRDEILSWARAAEPPTGMEDVVIALATGGASLLIKGALHAVLGPFDEQKADLQRCSAALKRGWDLLHEYKGAMLGADKQQAFAALKAAQDRLDAAWDAYKRERESAFAGHRREQEQKKESWLVRVNERIANLEERRDKLRSVLAHKESHLSDLNDKLRDAWSDDYRNRVSDWIREEENAIDEIRDKLSNVENWLSEERDKLRR